MKLPNENEQSLDVLATQLRDELFYGIKTEIIKRYIITAYKAGWIDGRKGCENERLRAGMESKIKELEAEVTDAWHAGVVTDCKRAIIELKEVLS